MNIKAIEELPILFWQKALMILVGAGIKDASEIGINTGILTHSEKDKNTFLKNRTIFKKTLEECLPKCEIPFKVKDYSPLDNLYNVGFKVYHQPIEIARSDEYLKKLGLYLDDTKIQNRDEELGKLFNFPKTAIDNYTNQKEFYVEEQRIHNHLRPFFSFRLSAKHYEEELKTFQLWLETVKEHSPFVYAGLMQNNLYQPTNASKEIIDVLNDMYDLMNME